MKYESDEIYEAAQMLKPYLKRHVDAGGCDEEDCGCFGSMIRNFIKEVDEFYETGEINGISNQGR